MKKSNLTFAGIVTIVMLAVTPFAFAQHDHPHRGPGGPDGGDPGLMMLGRLARAQQELGLTDQQVTQIKTIAEATEQQNAPYRQQLHAGMEQIAQTLIANPNDLAAAQTLADQQSVAEKTMKTNVLTAVSKALNVLTADQRTKLAALLAKRASAHND